MGHLAVAAALAVGAAACADDDGDNGETSPAVTEPAVTAPPTTEPPGTAPPGTEPTTTEPTTTEPSDDATPIAGSGGSWTVEHVSGIELTQDNVAPVIPPELADDRIDPDYWLWDWWPVRTRTGEVADFDGWNIAIALAAPSNVLPGQRHDIAELRYYLTDDGGRTWQVGGPLWDRDDAEGSRQWAGSAMYDEETGTLYSFYTAAGQTGERFDPPTVDEIDADDTGTNDDNGANGDTAPGYDADTEGITYEQRAAMSTTTVTMGANGPAFGEWTEHTILFEADGRMYAGTADTEGGAGEIDAFRDPEFFQDPATGDEYLTFTATMPVAECDGDGVVGIARRAADDDDLTSWTLMPPLIDAHCVNNELERPHFVVQDDRYYLLFTTHDHTFDGDLPGPEGLYGFVADSLMGPYEPLNGTGLVLANPESDPYQAYSWLTLPNGITTSFFQFWGLEGDVSLDYVGEQDPSFQLERFGGTFAPSVEIVFDGDTTTVGRELAPGQLDL
jgi:levansucrase